MKLAIYTVAMCIIAFSLFYMVSHIWYFIVSPMELFNVNSIEVNGRRVDKICTVVRIGGEYLIPITAVGELFGFKWKVEDEDIILSDDKNFRIQMKLFDPLVKVNEEEMMLRTPPILVEMPMLPERLFTKLLHCNIQYHPRPEPKVSKGIQKYLRSIFTSPLSVLNILIGVVYTLLWISLGHLTSHSSYKSERTWRIISRLSIRFNYPALHSLCYNLKN